MKQSSPAATRNSQPILEVLREVLPESGVLLEIASGTGQHAATLSRALPGWRWQPSDCAEEALLSIEAWRRDGGEDDFLPPLALDVCSELWPVAEADAIFCANMIHISPWASTQGLMRGAGQVLGPGGLLVLYGPFLEREVETAPSNQAFDTSLRARNPEWGIREREAVSAVAEEEGLRLRRRVEMPANNLILIFEKAWTL